MGWEPQVRRITRKGRRPYYRLRVNKKSHHLGTDRKEAYEKAAEILSGRPIKTAPQTVAGLILAWTREAGDNLHRLRNWGLFCGSKRLVELAHTDLQEYADHLRKQRSERTDELLAPWTIRQYVGAARKTWRWAHDRGWAPCAPGKAKTPQPVLEPRDMPIDQLRASLIRLNPRAKALASFILETGCRPSEARLLRWEQVNIEANVCVLRQHKTTRTGSLRTIPLTSSAIGILNSRPRTNEWVFNTLRGKPYTKDGLHAVLDRVGIKSVYALRHTFAQWFLDHGGEDGRPGDKAELQAWLGHNDGRMTDVYAQVRNTRLRDVARRISGPLAQ